MGRVSGVGSHAWIADTSRPASAPPSWSSKIWGHVRRKHKLQPPHTTHTAGCDGIFGAILPDFTSPYTWKPPYVPTVLPTVGPRQYRRDCGLITHGSFRNRVLVYCVVSLRNPRRPKSVVVEVSVCCPIHILYFTASHIISPKPTAPDSQCLESNAMSQALPGNLLPMISQLTCNLVKDPGGVACSPNHTALGGEPREQKMLKGHLRRVIYITKHT